MTVSELILELSECPRDMKVIITIDKIRQSFRLDQVLLAEEQVELVSEEDEN
jgi:hypothetical protein